MVAKIPVALDFPDEIGAAVCEVLNGEYESGFFGEDLTIIDVGANVGSFSIWANIRWPLSRIHAYEPHPKTFELLTTNVKTLSNITCHNVAVYPTENKTERFWSRYAGDGEAGLVTYMRKTFKELAPDDILEVPIIHPRELSAGDVLKLDVEGAEAAVLKHMNLKGVSLILLEYQNIENRDAIKDLLREDFALEYEDSFQWSKLVPHSDYREQLRGDLFGRLFFANKHHNRLRRGALRNSAAGHFSEYATEHLSLKQIISALPAAAKRAIRRRIANLF